MKKMLIPVMALAMACNSSQKTVAPTTETPQEVTPVTYANTITEGELKEMLYTFASDEFEGRDTGKEGQKKAAAYLRDHYIELGIPAAQSNGDYYQKVPLVKLSVPEGSFSFANSNYTFGEQILAFRAPAKSQYEFSSIVYAGYGIDDAKYSDYTNLDVKGKLLLIKSGEPVNNDGTFVVTGTKEASKWSNQRQALRAKTMLAEEKGAAGVLFIESDNFGRYIQQFNYLKEHGGNMTVDGNQSDFFSCVINTELASKIYKTYTSTATSATISGKASLSFKSNNEEVDTENVVAFIKGSEKPNEYIVISAHLDHVGVDENGNVFNGADDDGSGSVAILEIAEAFRKAQLEGNGPKRSIVFLHVTGEERGLLGSEYYAQSPIFPLANTVANLNIDMIGRIDPERQGNRNYVYVIGADKLSTELHEISEQMNEKYCGIELDYKYNDDNDPNRFYYRSDHYNFAKHNVPAVFYFNGTHDDYHRISDTPDKINYDLLTNRSKLIFHTAWELANREKRIVADKAK